MNEFGHKAEKATVADLGLKNVEAAFWNLEPSELVEETLVRGQGVLNNTGALAINTGEFTGRSPKDRFIVLDDNTKDAVWWGDINVKFDADKFDLLYDKMCAYLSGKEVFVRDAFACADEKYKLNIIVVNEYPWSNMFASNMFLNPSKEELLNFDPEWTILNAPGFHADPEKD